MEKPWSEAEKNYIKCSILMLIVGILMVVLSVTGWGIFSIVAGAIFAVVGVYMHQTRTEEPTQTAPAKSISEKAKGKSKTE